MPANVFAAKSRTRRIGALMSLRGGVIVILAMLLVSQAAAVSITGVNVADKADRVIVSVQGDAPLKMGVISSSTGRFIAFQFAGQLNAQGRMVSIRSGKIHNVRYARFQEKPPTTRIVFNTASRLNYSTSWNETKTRVDISVWKFGSNPAASVKSSEPANAAPPTEAVAVNVAAPTQNTKINGSGSLSEVLPVAQYAEPTAKITPLPGKSTAIAPPVSMPPTAPAQPIAVSRQPSNVNKPTAKPVVQAVKPASVPASAGAGKSVSVNFLGADIEDVLKAISVQSKENIVVGNDVAGKVTVSLDGVTIDEALEYVTRLSGYTYVKDKHTYLVGSLTSLGSLAGSTVEIVTLDYVSADDVLEMLKIRFPQVHSSKISVRASKARKHDIKTEYEKGSSGETQGQTDDGSEARPVNTPTSADEKGEAAAGSQAADQTSSRGTSSAKSSGALKATETVSSSAATDSPSSDMIILSGTPDRIEAAKEFISHVEDEMSNQASQKKISLYNVKYLNTVELANTLMSAVMGVRVMLAPSYFNAPSTAGQKLIPANVFSGENTTRLFDTEKNSHSFALIIMGRDQDVQKAMDLAAQFDVPLPTEDNHLLTYKLKYVGLKNIITTVRKLTPNVVIESAGMDPDEDDTGSGSSPAGSGAGSNKDGELREAGTDQTNVKQQTAMNAQAVDSLSRLIILFGRKYDVQKAISIIEMLDVKSPQIKIEAKFTALSESGEKKLGLDWNWGDFSKVEVSRNRWRRQPVDFGATLDALISNGDGTLLASPSLICLEGKPGQFFVGDEIRYVTQISVATNGAPTVTTDTANIGVQLSVVGSVSDDGNITLNLHPEVSTLKLDERMRSEAGITLPVITRRFTDHVVRVNNGDTIVIGGLILDSELDSLRKVPLLGDIPLFGHLFRHRDKTKERSEVVVFITASIVED